MSRAFVAASVHTLTVETAAVTAYPFTFACWAKVASGKTARCLWVGDKDVSNYFCALSAIQGGAVYAASHNYGVGSAGQAESTSAPPADEWFHAVGVFVSVSERHAYLNGGNRGSNTTTAGALGNHDRTAAGWLADSTPNYSDALLAWPCIWSVALSDSEVAALAAGAWPPSIQPASIVDLWDLTRNVSPETPLPGWGSHNLTVNGATFSTDNPPVAWPAAAFRRRSFGWSPGRA